MTESIGNPLSKTQKKKKKLTSNTCCYFVWLYVVIALVCQVVVVVVVVVFFFNLYKQNIRNVLLTCLLSLVGISIFFFLFFCLYFLFKRNLLTFSTFCGNYPTNSKNKKNREQKYAIKQCFFFSEN